jgi:putative transposase
VNAKRIYRLCCQEGLIVRTKKRKKAASRPRVPRGTATGPNQRWSMDFIHDRLADGRPFRVLTMVDQFTRECLLLLADASLTGLKVTSALDRALGLGVPPVKRPWRNGIAHWVGLVRLMAGARNRGDLGRFLHSLGFRWGMVRGSIKHRLVAF